MLYYRETSLYVLRWYYVWEQLGTIDIWVNITSLWNCLITTSQSALHRLSATFSQCSPPFMGVCHMSNNFAIKTHFVVNCEKCLYCYFEMHNAEGNHELRKIALIYTSLCVNPPGRDLKGCITSVALRPFHCDKHQFATWLEKWFCPKLY